MSLQKGAEKAEEAEKAEMVMSTIIHLLVTSLFVIRYSTYF